MSLIRPLTRRAPLAATLGLSAVLGFLPAVASATAIFDNQNLEVTVQEQSAEQWSVFSEVVASSGVSVTTGTTTGGVVNLPTLGASGAGSFGVALGSFGTADPLGPIDGEITVDLLTTIAITVTRLGGGSDIDAVNVSYSGFPSILLDTVLEEASASFSISLLDAQGIVLDSVLVTDMGGDPPDGTLSTVLALGVDEFADLSLEITTFGRAFSPGTGPPPTPAPEPATLSLLGLGLLATGYARRRRRH